MNKIQIKKILDRRNAKITGAIPGASCEANGLIQTLATVNGQTPAVENTRGSESGERTISEK